MPKLTSNKFIPQLHIPSWGWARQTPVVSAAGAASCAAKNSLYHVNHGRFIYYLFNSTNFWKYDTVTDGWAQLSSPTTAPATWSSMVFRSDSGVSGRVIAATSSTITLPAIVSPKGYETYEVHIVRGTGAGQVRVISSQAQATVADSGVISATAGSTITDSNKAWTVNQWRGYSCRIVNGTGVNQIRRIIANDATTLHFQSTTRAEADINAFPAAMSPLLVITAGQQAAYQIEASVCTLESNWSVTPDQTSHYEVKTGQIMLASGVSNAWSMQMYSVAEDLWYARSSYQSFLSANPTDGTVEAPDEVWTVLWNSKATSGTSTTLTDANANWDVNEFSGKWLRVFSGTGANSLTKITSNTQTVLTLATAITPPDSTSRYRVMSLEAGVVTTANTNNTITDSAASWTVNRYAQAYQVRIVAGTGSGQVRRIISNTATVLTLDKAVTTSTDTQYIIQPDASTAYLSFGLSPDVLRYGLDHDLTYRGVERDYGIAATACAYIGEERPVSIFTGTVAASVVTITTNAPHGFRTGDIVTHRGDTGASAAQNNITATITVTGLFSYTYPAPGSTTAWTVGANSTTTLRDASKSWTTNEHAGRTVYISGAFTATTVTVQVAQIASNTADTLTLVGTITAPPTSSRYVICDRAPIGSLDSGLATGTQSTTTMQDTTKSWATNIWAGRLVRFLNGTAGAQHATIQSNTSNTLTFTTVTTAPTTGVTAYSILAHPIRGAGIESVLPYATTQQGDDCRYLYIPRGGAQLGWDVFDLTNGSCRPFNLGQQAETLTTGSMFVYDGKDRIYFTKDVTNRVYYLNLVDGQLYSAPQIPYVAGTAIVGNRMDIVTTKDRLKILYVNRHSALEFFKTLLWY